MTYGQGTNMLTGKVFSNENEVLVWGIDSIYVAEDLKLCIGAEIISISQNFDERFWAIYRILDSNDSILSSDTFYIATSSEKHSINSIWQSTSNQYVKAALYILTRESNPAWFSLDNISIKELTDLYPSPLSLKSILLDSTQSEFEITISNSIGFSSISIANELDGNIYSGTDSVINIPAYSHSGYRFIGVHSSGCEVISSYWLSKPDSGAEYYASRIGIGTGSPVTHRQPWIREGCGLEYTINSVSTRTIGLHPNMSNCSPLNNPNNPISINFTIPDTCVRLEEVRIYWYEYSDLDTLLHFNASYLDTFTITNNTTSAQATITSGVLRGQLISHFVVQGQTQNATITAWRAIIPNSIFSLGNNTYTFNGFNRGTSAGDIDGITMVGLYTDLNGTNRGYWGVNESFMLNNNQFLYNNAVPPNVTPLNINNHCTSADNAEAFMVSTNFPVNSPIQLANAPVITLGTNCYSLFQRNNINLLPNTLSTFSFFGRYSGPFGMYWQADCDTCNFKLFANQLTAYPNTILCYGDSLRLNLTYLDTTGLSPNIVNNSIFANFVWSVGNPNPLTISPTFFIPAVNFSHNGWIFGGLTFSNPNSAPPILDCPVVWDSILIQVNPLPTASISASYTLICVGDSSILTIPLTGTGPWSVVLNQQTINTATSPLIVTVHPTTTTTYTISHVSDSYCDQNQNISIIIHVGASISASLTGSTVICPGNTSVITVAFTGTGPWNFSWSDGSISNTLTGITNNPYLLNVTASSTQWFYLTQVTDQCTTVNILDSIQVIVLNSPSGNISLTTDSVCPGSGTNLIFNFSGTGPWNFMWSDGTSNFIVTGITSSPYNVFVTPVTNITNYSLVWVSNAGCNVSILDTVILYWHSVPNLNLGNDLNFCLNNQSPDSVVIGLTNPYSGNFAYIWDNTILTHTIKVPTNASQCYELVALDSSTMCRVRDTICINTIKPPQIKVKSEYNCQTNCYTFTASIGSNSVMPGYYTWMIYYPNNPLPLPLNVAHYSYILNDTVTWCPDSISRMYYLALTVTDSFGCSTTYLDSIFHGDFTNINSPDVYICPIPDSAKLGNPILSSLQGFAFEWSGPNGIYSNLPNPFVTDSDAGIYTLIMMSSDSCYYYDTVRVHVCCLYFDASMPPPLDTFQIISDGTIINNNTVISPFVWITGDVEIQGDVLWQNKTVIVSPYARIDIPDSYFYCPFQPCGSNFNRLVLDSTHIQASSCDTMWSGIYIHGDSTYFDSISGGLYVLNYSLLEHAIHGIHSVAGGPYAIQNSTLNENHIHVYIEPFTQYLPGHQSAEHLTFLDGANFVCINRLKFPHTAERTYCGIYASHPVGNTGRVLRIPRPSFFGWAINYNAGMNYFNNMDVGVFTERTSLKISNCNFSQIECNGGFINPCPLNLFISPVHSAVITHLSDSIFALYNTFDRCSRGIYSRFNIDSWIQFNTMTRVKEEGVLVELSPANGKIDIVDNNIQNGRTAISTRFNFNASININRDTTLHSNFGISTLMNAGSTFNIKDNRIQGFQTSPCLICPRYTGINLVENNSVFSLIVENNNIRANFRGIALDGNPSGVRIRLNNIKMNRNFANAPNGITGLENHGISITNNNPSTLGFPSIRISKNTIWGPNINSTLNFINSQNNTRGIYVRNGFDNQIYCNTIDSVRDNFQADNVNHVQFRRNILGRGRTGILLNNGGIIGTQGILSSTYSYDNEFNCPYLISSLRSELFSVGSVSQIISKNSSPFAPCSTITTAVPINIFTWQLTHVPNSSTGDITFLSGSDLCSAANLRTSSDYPEESIEDAISPDFLHLVLSDDSVPYDSVNEVIKWNAKFQVYMTLHASDSLRNADSILTDFYYSSDSTIYGLIRRYWIAYSLGDYEDAIYWLEQIPDTNEYAYAYASVNKVLLKLVTGTTWNNLDERNDKDILRGIASNCPWELGMAVDLARNILSNYENDEYSAACEFPIDSLELNPEFEPDTLPGSWLHIFPNPSDTYTNIEHFWEDDGEMKITVLNNQGSIILSEPFAENENEMVLDTSEWQQGAYYVILTKDGGYLESRILVVYHP